MSRADDELMEQAAAWHAASSNDSMDWDGFTAWLEADPRHAAAYDEVALADSLLAEHGAVLDWPVEQPVLAANDDDARPLNATRRRWIGGAIAASLLALLVVPQLRAPAPEIHQSGAQALTIALDDGSEVILAPRSRLEITGKDQAQMALSGGAWFDIRHRPDRMLAIEAGGLTISDIGTRFDIQSNGKKVRVEVEEGFVTATGQDLSAPLRLTAGRALDFDPVAGTALLNSVAASDIGEWRQGRLSYSSVPLSRVASDISRYAGVDVMLANGVSDRVFSGTLVIGNGQKAVEDLAQLMGLGVSGGDRHFRLEPQR